MEARAALFEMCEKSEGKGVGIKCGGVAQPADSHIVNDIKDEGGGAAETCVVEGVILDKDPPNGLKFLGLVDGVLQYGG